MSERDKLLKHGRPAILRVPATDLPVDQMVALALTTDDTDNGDVAHARWLLGTWSDDAYADWLEAHADMTLQSNRDWIERVRKTST